MAERTHLFTDDDIKKILSEQSDIRTQLAEAATNLTWIVKNYDAQCKDTENSKKEISNIKIILWKYIGIGIGAGLGINLVLSIAVYIATGGKVMLA